MPSRGTRSVILQSKQQDIKRDIAKKLLDELYAERIRTFGGANAIPERSKSKMVDQEGYQDAGASRDKAKKIRESGPDITDPHDSFFLTHPEYEYSPFKARWVKSSK